MRTRGAGLLAAPHHPLPELHIWLGPERNTGALQFGARQDEQPPQLMLVEIPDRIDQVSIERHLTPLRSRKVRTAW